MGGITFSGGAPDRGQAGHLGERLAEGREALEREGAVPMLVDAAELVVVQTVQGRLGRVTKQAGAIAGAITLSGASLGRRRT